MSVGTLTERFWANVERTDECWNWTARTNEKGYGPFAVAGKPVTAHRLSYELNVGKIVNGSWVLHSCDNPKCVRPDHLRLGNNLDNMRDKMGRGRHNGLHPAVKLSVEIARTIESSSESKSVLAARYGVGQTTIMRIKRGQHWTTNVDR